MTEGNAPAFASMANYNDDGELLNVYEGCRAGNEYGLTKREYFAARAMQGFIAAWGQHDLVAADEIAHDSVFLADALINELNKQS